MGGGGYMGYNFACLWCGGHAPPYDIGKLLAIFSSHEIEIRPSSVRPSPVVRPAVCGINYLWTYCVKFFQILVAASPGPYAWTFLNFWKKKMGVFFTNIFRFRLHGTLWEPKLQNATSLSNYFWIFSTFFWIFFWVVLTKILCWIFEIIWVSDF